MKTGDIVHVRSERDPGTQWPGTVEQIERVDGVLTALLVRPLRGIHWLPVEWVPLARIIECEASLPLFPDK